MSQVDNHELKATEHQEQAALIQWARLHEKKYPELRLLFAIPNGGLRNKATAGKLRAEGVKAGVPDLCLPVARLNYHGLYIELKTKSGRLSVSQRMWFYDLLRNGYLSLVCFGWEAARDAISNYLAVEDIRHTVLVGHRPPTEAERQHGLALQPLAETVLRAGRNVKEKI